MRAVKFALGVLILISSFSGPAPAPAQAAAIEDLVWSFTDDGQEIEVAVKAREFGDYKEYYNSDVIIKGASYCSWTNPNLGIVMSVEMKNFVRVYFARGYKEVLSNWEGQTFVNAPEKCTSDHSAILLISDPKADKTTYAYCLKKRQL